MAKQHIAYQVTQYVDDIDEAPETLNSEARYAAGEYAERLAGEWPLHDRDTLDVWVQESGKPATRQKFVVRAHLRFDLTAEVARG